ncbi:hypothetical protein TWF106_002720 [Orbilia oligospora]|uniref:F-box domain-containing protein n=1 Tax=Orbilia oligospora TaxID=2813651 RepID=A0A7C8Q883_ORBOL|nr:hypothetical protein TWF106_002720 [Orbilia oligospora]KAF3212019.1 hypothetical protein TWF679_006143 [Orbilia oligospora]
MTRRSEEEEYRMNAISPILTLPNEILAKIFGDNHLSDVDTSRLIQVCKLFKGNIQKFVGQKFTFTVDDISHSGWRFVRCLLRNPEIGEPFVDITVKWDRRNWKLWKYDKKPWTTDWIWSESEKIQISTLCDKWGINENTKSVVLGGKNSEALMSLILCFTPNLKALDLGEVDLPLVDIGMITASNDTSVDLNILELLGHDFDEDDDEEDYSYYESQAQRAQRSCVRSYQPRNHSLFFFDNLQYKSDGNIVGPKILFPGLANLEYFRIGGPKKHHGIHGVSLQQSECFSIFLLPRIQSVEMFALFSDYDSYEPITDTPSTLKRLTFTRGFTNRQDPERVSFFEKVSKITVNLERVYINAKFSMFDGDVRRFFEPIARVFLRNTKYLEPSNILVNGGGFNEMGEWSFSEERRREVARKQKAFELIRGKLRTLKVCSLISDLEEAANHLAQPPPIVATSSKILPEILKHLRRNDVFRLMLACRAIYDICYPDMWASLRFGSHHDWEYFRASVGRAEAVQKWAKSVGILGGGGLEHLEVLELTRAFYSTDRYRESPKTILSVLANQVELGNTPKLNQLSLNWANALMIESSSGGVRPQDPENLRFCHAIKEYSQKKTPKEFRLSLGLNLASLLEVNPSSLLDLRKLRDLDVVIKWGESLDISILAANALVDVLSDSPNLENVTLRSEISLGNNSRNRINEEITPLWEAISSLQTVIGNLEHLCSLSIIGALSIYPSFLLIPPPSCKSVSYSGMMTTSWWKKFANFPFAGIECMTLECADLDPSEGRVMGRITNQGWTPVQKFKLGDVKVSTLKRLSVSPPSGGLGNDIKFNGYPSDFVECMLKNNTQLSDECLRPLAIRIAESYTKERENVMLDILHKQVDGLRAKLSATLKGYAESTALKALGETRSIGEGFQSEMRDTPIDMLVQQFERELGPNLITEFAEVLRVQLRQGLPILPPSSRLTRFTFDSEDDF